MTLVKPYDDNKYVGCVVWLSGGEKDIFLREWFDEYIEVPFEEYTFRIPRMYDKILKHIYGDYIANFPKQSNSSPLRKCPKPAKILYFSTSLLALMCFFMSSFEYSTKEAIMYYNCPVNIPKNTSKISRNKRSKTT